MDLLPWNDKGFALDGPELMPYTDSHPSLPFSGKTATSRHTSYLAGVAAARTRGAKSQAYLEWLQAVGQGTDWAAAEHFTWPLSSVCSIRNNLVDKGLVEVCGICQGRYGKRVALWRVR